MDLDRNNQPPLRSRSRSPARPSPPHRPSADRGPMSIDGRESDVGESDQPRFGANVPTQPRGLGGRQSPPTGPSHGPRGIPPHRGSQNLSVLSAPTRPRRGHGSRDGPWSSGPMPRRGPISSTPHGPPSGPRASFSSGMPGGNFRHPGSRQNSTVSGPPPALPVPKPPGHLAGLATVIPAGRVLPSGLDPVAEKRLAQLEADHERLLQQMAETQRQKRAGLRDWDRLDHESSICALKSELADGHLQRMADEAIGGGVPF
ncbi:hypothetical protein N7488_000149 [Penicillium malachiteum]|nr:hypothetical protein N7488_000149 [Penicillium malachiteum]